MVSIGLIVNQLLTGLSIGAQLFLVAVGLSLIFGVLGVLNFAHGALYMIGSYMAIVVAGDLFGGFWLGVVAAGVVVGVLGVVIEAGFIRRLYDRDILDQLLLTFAFVLILTNTVRSVFGSGSRTISPPSLFEGTVQLTSGLSITTYRVFVIVVSVVVLVGLFTVLRTTSTGRLVRATSSDRTMARLLGVNVPRLYTGVFFAGCVLAGVGGALAAPLGAVTPQLGNTIIIDAFVVVVIGGLGSFVGAFVGAYIIGILVAVGSLVVPGAGQLLPFVVMIVVLLAKPEGLFGGVEP